MNVSIPVSVLTALIDMASSHTEDIESGLEDGTYEAADNKDLPQKKATIAEASTIYAAFLKAAKTDCVTVTTGVPESEQQSSFQNATLQSASDALAFSVATDIAIPPAVAQVGEGAVADYLRDNLRIAAVAMPGLAFTIQLGKSDAAERGAV